jgi:hypothetical protein
MKYRVAILLQNGIPEAQDFETRNEVDDYILAKDPKRFRIMDKETNEIIEDEKGRR